MSGTPQAAGAASDVGVAAAWAASGAMVLSGHPDGPPLLPPGRAAHVARELAERFAGSTGAPRLDGARLLAERAACTGHVRRGRVSAGGASRLLPTADGWAAVSCARPDDPALLGALASADVRDDPWPVLSAWLRGHTGAELAGRAELLGIAAGPVRAQAPPSHVPAPAAPRPVKDALVVDFSALWAGPLCAHLLSLAGARVVKVETPTRPDGARYGDPGFYRLLHAGHRSVVLDPATTAGRNAMAALVDAADIIIEASRPRALARFGLDADAAVATGTVWVSITANGRSSERVGFGDDVAAGAGLVCRDPDLSPLFCGDAVADPLTGLTAAVLAASAPPGRGVLWDVSMTDVVAATLEPGPPLPSTPAARRGDGWAIETGVGLVPVASPERREPGGDAPAMGADTGEVLRSLGIPLP
ncbi:CoA transferase [Spirillospora sp. NPDC000708]|uniref:CoA transferase n=1 Tax=Actinomadura physcomitrii TaxID=2650748 RepID=A0A6I4MI97_9ACTN|nr:CoA transferase [Actinomadura physcomitrii]MWA02359.1 CoA transferase [Actinomadura physcomitrii]MWA03069.1 CoA transferase [Actinomadura physcomitrii]